MMFVSFFYDDSLLDVHCFLMCLIALWCSFPFVLINPLIYNIYFIEIVLCLVGTCPTTCNLAFAYALVAFWICVVAPRLTPMYHSGLIHKHIAKLLWNWFLCILNFNWNLGLYEHVPFVCFSMDLWIAHSTIVRVLVTLLDLLSSFPFAYIQ
jgi:hypothetical protein